MSFYDVFRNIPFKQFLDKARASTFDDVRKALGSSFVGLPEFLTLISPAAGKIVEEVAQKSHVLTVQRFGNIIQLYAPLYISNKCHNSCVYCGFRNSNDINRITLSYKEILEEAYFLKNEGFKHILVVSGEYSHEINTDFLAKIVPELKKSFPSVSVEIAPHTTAGYANLCSMGVDGVVSYQETYNADLYKSYHPSGKKSDFSWRVSTPERAGEAGMRKIGIGSLLGLYTWQYEAIALYHHIRYITKNFWKAQVSLSFPRLQSFSGSFVPPYPVSNLELVQLVCAMRLAFPDLVLTLSTREGQGLRDGLLKLGITQLSAGSKTDPGGYMNHDEENEQFEVQDNRSASQMADKLKHLGYEPVWKDWEESLGGSAG